MRISYQCKAISREFDMDFFFCFVSFRFVFYTVMCVCARALACFYLTKNTEILFSVAYGMRLSVGFANSYISTWHHQCAGFFFFSKNNFKYVSRHYFVSFGVVSEFMSSLVLFCVFARAPNSEFRLLMY